MSVLNNVMNGNLSRNIVNVIRALRAQIFSEKLTLSWAGGKNNISVRAYRTCAYPGVRNVSFSENFAYVLNGRSHL